MRKLLIIILIILLLMSCDLIDVHPYDGRLDCAMHQNDRNIEQIERVMQGRDTICFAVISDTQRWYDEMRDEVENINRRSDVDFVIHCGDLSDFGITKEFEWQTDILQGLRVPYVVLLGNHDCIGSGKEVFRDVFGNENFSFTAGFLRFVCLDTNALEYDFSAPVPNLSYMKNEGDNVPDGVEATIVAMHVCPYADEFNDDVADAFEYYIHRMRNPLCCIYGHGHSTESSSIFDDGLLYHQITCAKYRQYYVFTVTRGGYSYETVVY